MIFDARRDGALYAHANPFKTAEMNAEANGRLDELAYWTDQEALSHEMFVEGTFEEDTEE